MSRAIAFCATGKTGLGHLRRVANIAGALRAQAAARPVDLLTNAAWAGRSPADRALFRRIERMPRRDMARRLLAADDRTVVVDTAVLPGLHDLDAPLCLILRATVQERVAAFRLAGGRPWDLVVLPEPAGGWRPAPDLVPARRMAAVGYIFRRPPAPHGRRDAARRPTTGPPTVLIASGGGNEDTARAFRVQVTSLVHGLRSATRRPLQIVQALGPRMPDQAGWAGADAIWRPGAALHEGFARADLVISAAGYNTVLELACTDVPALLVPVARSYDDQAERARLWADRLGLCHRADAPERSVRWMRAVLAERRRRRPADLGASGAARCAALIAELG